MGSYKATNIWRSDYAGGTADALSCLGSTLSISLQIEKIDTLSSDHAILPNIPLKPNVAEF